MSREAWLRKGDNLARVRAMNARYARERSARERETKKRKREKAKILSMVSKLLKELEGQDA